MSKKTTPFYFLKLDTREWRASPQLRNCSLAARGLAIEMLTIMSEASPRGSLITGGKPVAPDKLHLLVGAEKKEVTRLLAELESNGIFGRDPDGTVFSGRMRREAAKSEEDRANGAKGGNPTLTPTRAQSDAPPDGVSVEPLESEKSKRGVNPPDKAREGPGVGVGDDASVKGEDNQTDKAKMFRGLDTGANAPGAEAPGSAPPDYPTEPVKRLWAEGVDRMRAMGCSERQAKTNIGRWRKCADPPRILDAIRRASDKGTQDPIPFVNRILSPVKTTQNQKDGVGAAIQSIQTSGVLFGKRPAPLLAGEGGGEGQNSHRLLPPR